MRFQGLAVGILVASSVCISTAQAGPAEDIAAAEALFREGRALVKSGKYAEACPKLEASRDLDLSVGTLLALGDCYEFDGKTASAWATFTEARALAKKRDDKRRETEAIRRADLLEPKLSKLSIEVGAESRMEGLEVSRNGKTISESLFGSAVPVDPGEQLIEAKAPGKKAWSTKVQVEPKPNVLTVRIPVLEAEPAAAVDTPSTTPTTGQTAGPSAAIVAPAPKPPDHVVGTSSKQKTVGFIVGGAGLLSVIVGSLAGVEALSEMSNVREKNLCTDEEPARCNGEGIDRVDAASSSAMVSNITIGLGGAALVTGIVLIATAPKSTAAKAKTSLHLSPWVGPTMAGISLQGAF